MRFAFRLWRKETFDSIVRWVAWHLPHPIVYHATIRAWVFSTSGKHATQEVTSVTTAETVRRWDQQDH